MFSRTKGVPPVGGDGDLLALRTVVIGLSRKYLNLKSDVPLLTLQSNDDHL